MSTSITAAFITQYERDVHDVFQRQGSVLKPTVRFRTGVKGSSAVFQKIAKGAATTKARHGTITPMNQTHTSHTATLSDFYAGDWVDRLDEAKINIEERMAIARGGAYALGRKVDSQILTTLDSTTQTTLTMTTTSYAAVRNHFVSMIGDLMRLDSYENGMMYGVVSPVTLGPQRPSISYITKTLWPMLRAHILRTWPPEDQMSPALVPILHGTATGQLILLIMPCQVGRS